MSQVLLHGGLRPDLWDPDSDSLERWSRTIGALGLNPWLTLVRQRFVVLGDGFLADEMAQSLTRIGVRQLQRIAVARPIETDRPRASGDWLVQRLVNDADFLVTGDIERSDLLVVAAVASACLRPALYLSQPDSSSAAVGSIVLVVPGGPCLLCTAGTAIQTTNNVRPPIMSAMSDFVVACAQRLLEDFLAARVPASVVVRIELDQAGLPAIRYNSPGVSRRDCPTCAVRGSGDSGLSWLITHRA